MAARTAGVDKNKEITLLSTYVLQKTGVLEETPTEIGNFDLISQCNATSITDTMQFRTSVVQYASNNRFITHFS